MARWLGHWCLIGMDLDEDVTGWHGHGMGKLVASSSCTSAIKGMSTGDDQASRRHTWQQWWSKGWITSGSHLLPLSHWFTLSSLISSYLVNAKGIQGMD